MVALPPALTTVEVPESFSPSALGTWGGCALKLALGSAKRGPVERLIPGPEAALGTLIHRVLERVARRTETSSSAGIFDAEYERMTEEFKSDPRRRHYSDLRSTKTLAEWTRLKAWVLQRCDRLTPRVAELADSNRPQGVPTGPEVHLESADLRLRGKADRIRRVGPSAFEVRDYKSGGVLSEDGTVKEEVALQVRAYGLMILERDPQAAVRLVVDDGTDREVEFDDHARREARQQIQAIVSRLPGPGNARVEPLAKPGAGCWGCGIRHVCPVYRGVAPNWWHAYPTEVERIPNDTWGMLDAVEGDERINIVLTDGVGRRVRVDGLELRHGLSRDQIGSRIWFFELESSGPARGFDGSRFHPRVFHELPRDRRERRAWKAQVFEEPGQRAEPAGAA